LGVPKNIDKDQELKVYIPPKCIIKTAKINSTLILKPLDVTRNTLLVMQIGAQAADKKAASWDDGIEWMANRYLTFGALGAVSQGRAGFRL
jgi:hypothetical protein